jgi:hypothetical protein
MAKRHSVAVDMIFLIAQIGSADQESEDQSFLQMSEGRCVGHKLTMSVAASSVLNAPPALAVEG